MIRYFIEVVMKTLSVYYARNLGARGLADISTFNHTVSEMLSICHRHDCSKK